MSASTCLRRILLTRVSMLAGIEMRLFARYRHVLSGRQAGCLGAAALGDQRSAMLTYAGGGRSVVFVSAT
jgi:hypothetical protein